MSYAQGGIIDDADYNTLAWGTAAGGTYTTSPANLAVVWGQGTGRYGYGASTSGFTQVTAGTNVTAAQWTGMIQRINNALSHQGLATITPTSVTAGSLITYYNTISSGITSAFNSSGGVASLNAGTPTSTQYTSSWGQGGERNLVFTHTVTFASANQARYFFNAGGAVQLTFSRSGGSATTRNSEWTDLCTKCGAINIGYLNTTRSGGANTPTVLLNSGNGGYWNLTTSENTHFQLYADTSPYTTNFIRVTASWSGTAQNGGYPVLTIKSYWENDFVNPSQDTVDGTCTTGCTLYTPPTTYIGSATWGTPSVGGSVVAS